MGTFKYDSTLTAEFDDRLLAHLQLVIGAKLRRGENFYFSWRDDVEVGDGRTTIWMHNSLPLVFKYHGSRVPPINRKWVDALMNHGEQPRRPGHHARAPRGRAARRRALTPAIATATSTRFSPTAHYALRIPVSTPLAVSMSNAWNLSS